jgi:hypothetical protein
MGNSLSPFLAKLFMTNFGKQCKNIFPYFHKTWYRYVYGVFAIFDTSKGNISDFLKKLNNQYGTIKFRLEKEKENTLPFLDILIKSHNNKLTTTNSQIYFTILRTTYHCSTSQAFTKSHATNAIKYK